MDATTSTLIDNAGHVTTYKFNAARQISTITVRMPSCGTAVGVSRHGPGHTHSSLCYWIAANASQHATKCRIYPRTATSRVCRMPGALPYRHGCPVKSLLPQKPPNATGGCSQPPEKRSIQRLQPTHDGAPDVVFLPLVEWGELRDPEHKTLLLCKSVQSQSIRHRDAPASISVVTRFEPLRSREL